MVQSHVLYKTPIDDRIYTMSVPWGRNEYLYWISTSRDILLLDIREPMIPITCQPHYMEYSPPIYSQLVAGTTHGEFDCLWEDKIHDGWLTSYVRADFLFLWSSLYDHVICAKYQRSHNTLTKYVAKHNPCYTRMLIHLFYTSEDLSSPTLSSLFEVIQSIPIEEVHSFYQGEVNVIPTTGFYAVFSSSSTIDDDTGESRDVDTFIYFRLLQDGSIRTLVFSEQQGEWTKYQKVGWKLDNDALPADVRHTNRLISIKSTGDLAGGLLNGMIMHF